MQGDHRGLHGLGRVLLFARSVFHRGEAAGGIDLDDNRPRGARQQVENESLEFDRVRRWRLDSISGRSRYVRHFLASHVKRQPAGVALHPFEKRAIENMDGDAAGPELERAVGILQIRATSSGKSLYSMISQTAVDRNDVPDSLQRKLLPHDLRCHLRAGEQMVAEELRIAELGERIIDLEIEDVSQSSASHVGQAAAFGQRREHPAVAVRAQRQSIA